ncbi:MAG: hypothetical protein KDA85_12620, partial [Planctomycetaceae bacterium]|nr:hypothetical protein [Planctomycetaceae bacterium]
MLTVNPLLDPSEIRERSTDKLVESLNAEMEYSLLKNKGKYSLVVATFTGKSLFQVGNRQDDAAVSKFDTGLGDSLDESAMQAWYLTEALRNAKKFGYDQNYDAWVFHDRYKSVVTIGSFNSPGDPQIRTLATQFGAKPARHAETGEPIEIGEYFTIPRQPRPGQLPDRSWLFDGRPELMRVPGRK